MEPGKTLAHYRIEGMLGQGGMGEVYRAHDTKLGRDVALKILPQEFLADPERVARFKREAKVLASLNHPNIAAIFGFETTPDATFLVMELVEGEDLAEILRRGPLSVDEAVDVACQIAAGLEEAHEKGIVHRDLKPANVKRTPDGKVKVLDFGLARAFSGQTAGEESISSAPTMTAAMTQVGSVLGTAAYMSPEQARGKEVDRRADIWAFGVMLFEMLTGKQTFVGETASDTLAGILKSEPEWDALPAGLPFQVQRVLRRCLAKDPRQRLRDIGEARVRLEHPDSESTILSGPVAAVADAEGRGGRSPLRLLPWGLLVASVAVIGWLVLAGGRGGEPERALYVALPAPKGVDFHVNGSYPGLPEISPDGRRVAFGGISAEDNSIQLYVRSIDAPKAVALSDTRDAQYPFWAPDSKWLAYYVRAEGLMKIPVDGGPPQLVCKASNGKGGSWNQFGDILLTLDYNTSLYLAPAAGGEARPITDLKADTGFNSHRHPQFMPDGRHFIYFARAGGQSTSQIRFASLDDSTTTVVTTGDYMGYYASGYLVFVSHGNIVAQPFDPDMGTLSGSPHILAEEVLMLPGASKAAFSVSQTGSLEYIRGESSDAASLVWRDRAGRELGKVGDKAVFDFLSLSPDGKQAAIDVLTEQIGTWDVWLVDLDRNFRTRFTSDSADDKDMVWSRDSRNLYFISDRIDPPAVFVKAVGSPEAPHQVFQGSGDLRLWDVSDDGKTLIYSQGMEARAYDMFTVDLDGEAKPRSMMSSPENDVIAQFSPDGRWVVFASGESGVAQVYLAPWPAMQPISQVSTTTGTWAAWTKGGRELIYQESDNPQNLVAVSMTVTDGRMVIGPPEILFEGPPVSVDGSRWAPTSDGEKFLTVAGEESNLPGHCVLVLNWPRAMRGN